MKKPMPRPEELEEFQFTYGDPRPVLLQYLATWPAVSTHVATRFGAYGKGQARTYGCRPRASNPAKQAMGFRRPGEKPAARLRRLVERGAAPLVAIPVLLAPKAPGCPPKAPAQQGRHGILLLYNRATHEIDRIDIKRYHLRGYPVRASNEALTRAADRLVAGADPEAHMTYELDVPLSLLKKIGVQRSRDAFPMYVLAYLEMRAKHPQKDAHEIRAALQNLAPSTFARAFERYVAFRRAHDRRDPCRAAGFVRNMETGRCMRPLSRTFRQHLVAPPPAKACAGTNGLSNKRVNAMVDDASRYYVRNTAAFVKPGSEGAVADVMAYLVHRYPTARFVVGQGTGREDRIAWTNFGARTSLRMPTGYWEAFEDGMMDPRVRFLVTNLSLVGWDPRDATHIPRHANVLLYDKNTNELERFDPHGYTAGFYRIEDFDDAYREMLNDLAEMFPGKQPPEYLEPEEFCPRGSKVFQAISGTEVRLFGDTAGTCDTWRFWYINLRLANPHLTRAQAVALAHSKLADTSSLYKFIKSYQYHLVRASKEHARRQSPKARKTAPPPPREQ